MAEIEIEKKSPIWPWILAALALIALLLYFFVWNRDDADTMAATDETGMVEPVASTGAVAEYIDYIKNDADKMGLDHDYANAALEKLTRAVEAKAADTGYDVKADLDEVRQYADNIKKDEFASTHANSIRKADEILARALQNMQAAKYPALSAEAEAVSNAATQVNPDVLTLDQKGAVKGFFDKAADLLQKMN